MKKYLLAAEADKIQDIIFRAVRLREILGGSQLLTNWCNDMKRLMLSDGVPEGNIIVADGGAFRVIFDDESICRSWGERLAEDYRRNLGGTLSVTLPIPFELGSYSMASSIAQNELRKIKNSPSISSACIQNPYSALCDVCGVEVGSKREFSYENKRETVCTSCSNKLHVANSKKINEEFLSRVKGQIKGDINLRMPIDGSQLAKYDNLSNIAYLVADGNNMGVLFSQCDMNEMKELSEQLPEIILDSLANACADMIERLYEEELSTDNSDELVIPVLPLILGGDDIFVIVATPYCLDFARRFAQRYHEHMENLVNMLDIDFKPGICVGLAISKDKNPHTLAYRCANELLDDAKMISRSSEESLSLISFGKVGVNKRPIRDFNNTLKAYNLLDTSSNRYILPLKHILDCRIKLKDIPNSRLAKFHSLYDIQTLPSSIKEKMRKEEWLSEFEYNLRQANRKPEHNKSIKEALEILGSNDSEVLYMRPTHYIERASFGTGLPDLLDFWDYCLDLSLSKEEYSREP